MHIFNDITEDLHQVQLLLSDSFSFRAGHLGEFAPMEFNHLDMNLRPAIVITACRLFGPVTRQAFALAAILQFIYMASRIHAGVKEGASGKERPLENRLGYQYPVLVGDYIYGKFFTTLCDFGIERYLKSLAELICSINKSGIHILRNPGMEHTEKQLYLDVVRGETAETFACGAFLGADLAGAAGRDKDYIFQVGLNLGMAYGLLERGATVKQVKEYLTAAEILLIRLPSSKDAQFIRDLLVLLTQENTVQCMVG